MMFESIMSHRLGVKLEKIQKFTFDSSGNFESLSISSLFVMYIASCVLEPGVGIEPTVIPHYK